MYAGNLNFGSLYRIRNSCQGIPSQVLAGSPDRGGNSYRGLGIHVPARIMGQFAIFCPDNGSCFVKLALVMDLFYRHLPQLWVNSSFLHYS